MQCYAVSIYFRMVSDYVCPLVAGCGVCHSDLHVIKGEIPFSSPCAIGHEITGEVVEHGSMTDGKIIERYVYQLCAKYEMNFPF